MLKLYAKQDTKMPEQKVVITIDDEGGLTAKTSGFKGESCLDALDGLLDMAGVVSNLKKTDEFRQKQSIEQSRIQKVKGK